MKQISQNAHYTFKHNVNLGRHGWLRLTPAYSVKVVEHILSTLDYIPVCVFEPFSGTGTTELVCANLNIESFACDINPFLVWLAQMKTKIYSEETIKNFQVMSANILKNIGDYHEYKYPDIFQIERWWDREQLSYLAKLKTAIWETENSDVKNLLKIAFCRQIIILSNARFNHVSVSFKNSNEQVNFTYADGNAFFSSICESMAKSIRIQPVKTPQVLNANSMCIEKFQPRFYDTIITSPPYPNRISYMRELRPYMYWLDYLKTAKEASNLDWNTIGGTWGIATSKLSSWRGENKNLPDYLYEIAENISKANNKSAGLMKNYVLKYFSDIAIHMRSVFDTISSCGTVHYIVGNSNFYGNVVPSERIYSDILSSIGFVNVNSETIRKRNCNKSLYEFWISAQKF